MACERLRKGLVCQYIYIVASSLGLMLFFLPRLPACMHVCHFPSCLTCQAALVILRRAACARLKVVGRSNSGPILRLAQASWDGHSSMHDMRLGRSYSFRFVILSQPLHRRPVEPKPDPASSASFFPGLSSATYY